MARVFSTFFIFMAQRLRLSMANNINELEIHRGKLKLYQTVWENSSLKIFAYLGT